MKADEIDRILLDEVDTGPSPGFHDRVMGAIHREVATLPPIPFPWKRAWPAVAAAAVVLVAVPVLAVQALASGPSDIGSPFPAAQNFVAVWIAVAAISTLGSVLLSWRLAEERY
jgi:hypothetical protein